jgi:hypothetical protein
VGLPTIFGIRPDRGVVMGFRTARPMRAGVGVAVAVTVMSTGCGSVSAQPPATVLPCAWTPAFDAYSSNFLAPDTFADYWVLPVPDIPGMSLTLTGRYPHSRYASISTYTPDVVARGLRDQQIEPDPGSLDPFLTGADRNANNRNYTVRIRTGTPSGTPPANTLYTGTGAANRPAALILYRVYRPDEGQDRTGGTGLPTVTVNLPGAAALPAGSCPAPTAEDPTATHPDPFPVSAPARSWQQAAATTDYGNPDNRYLISVITLRPHQVAVIHAAMPTTPSTYPGTAIMGAGQLRYWSMCANGPLFGGIVTGCAVDDQVPLDRRGEYTIMISAPADRPADATPACGVAWLPSGGPSSTMMMRNMLPDPAFRQSIQAARPGHEADDMGPYYPNTRILDTAAATTLGCPARTP